RDVDAAQLVGGGRIPGAQRVVETAREQGLAVRRILQGVDACLMAVAKQLGAGRHVPNPHAAADSSRSHALAVAGIRNGEDRAVMTRKPANLLAEGHVPLAEELITAPREQSPAVR